MAYRRSDYKLKYYKDFINLRHEQVRLYISEKTTDAIKAKEIGALSGLSLEVDGKSDPIDTPIVKTSLTFSIIDCSDLPDEPMKKWGNWEEFYTPDATKYLVEVFSTKPNKGPLDLRWSGFITPDSWQQSLGYRGAITIVARDGIGTLNDIPFKMDAPDGMVKSRDLIAKALGLANVALGVTVDIDETSYPHIPMWVSGVYSGNVEGLYYNVTAFEDKTWYEALEDVLVSSGLVLRYTDYNSLVVAPLRYLPRPFFGDGAPAKHTEITFLDGSKILDPSYKEVVDTIDFGYTPSMTFPANGKDKVFRDDEQPTYQVDHLFRWDSKHVYHHPTTGVLHNSMDYGDDGTWDTGGYPTFLDAHRYRLDHWTKGESVKDYLYYAVNADTTGGDSGYQRIANFKKRVAQTACKIVFEFAAYPASVRIPKDVTDWWSGKNGELCELKSHHLTHMWISIWYQNDISTGGSTIRKFWDGRVWTNESCQIEKVWDESAAATSLEFVLPPCPDIGANGYLVFSLRGASYTGSSYYGIIEDHRGIFLRIKGISFEDLNDNVIESHTTKTLNQLNTACNVRLVRELKFGVLPDDVDILFNENYKNAMFIKVGNDLIPAPYKWKDYGAPDAPEMPFPSFIARQLMMYHAASEAVIDGEFAPSADADAIHISDILVYKGIHYMLQGGTLDFTTGRMVSSTIRSFHEYEEIFK